VETYIFRILTAAVVGYLIGLINFKHAPVKMFSIICMGAALVSITSTEFFKLLDLPWSSDPGRLTAQSTLVLIKQVPIFFDCNFYRRSGIKKNGHKPEYAFV
jgi:hypothetical protein